jgi:hypothetical protein
MHELPTTTLWTMMPSHDAHADRLPVDVLVTALASRLADLQGARVDSQSPAIVAPVPQEEAGRRALVAGSLLESLEARLEQGESGFVPLGLLSSLVAATIPDLEPEELRFCVRFLDIDREIRYQELVGGTPQERVTRGWSRLVRYQSRLDRVKLTDAGRLWVRVLRHREHWLFEDKEVEKLVVAITNGLWEQIPLIASEVITSIRLFNEHLTDIVESPSFRDLVRQYLERRVHFSTMIERCHTAGLHALELLLTDAVAARHAEWSRSIDNNSLSLSVLYEQASCIHRSTESLRRNWTTLLDAVQQDKRPRVGILRFDLALDKFTSDPPSTTTSVAMLDGLGGWGNDGDMLSIHDFEGTLPEAVEPDAPNGLEIDLGITPAGERIQSWLVRNRRRLLAALMDGPKSLFELLADPMMAIGGLSDVSAAFGIYLITDPLGTKHRVSVEGQLGALANFEMSGHLLTVSDVVLRLVPDGDGGSN